LTISTRNIKQVDLKAYPVKLDEILLGKSLNDPHSTFTSFETTLGKIEDAR